MELKSTQRKNNRVDELNCLWSTCLSEPCSRQISQKEGFVTKTRPEPNKVRKPPIASRYLCCFWWRCINVITTCLCYCNVCVWLYTILSFATRCSAVKIPKIERTPSQRDKKIYMWAVDDINWGLAEGPPRGTCLSSFTSLTCPVGTMIQH